MLNGLVAQLLTLGAQGFSHWAVHVAGVDQQHLALTLGRFVVRQHPDIGGDTGVVEHVGGQGHQGIEQVVFQDVAADLALAAARSTGKERGAVEDDADPGTLRLHLGDKMLQEQE